MQHTQPETIVLKEMFQSSPDPEAGCNRVQPKTALALFGVSILTRPGGRVQPAESLSG